MNLSGNFSLSEFTDSGTAVRQGIDNTPPAEVIERLRKVADTLERVREILGAPIYVTSGYRCPVLNTAIGSKPSSAHVRGWAADFKAPRFGSPIEIVRKLDGAGLQCDQLIQEGQWVHLSIDPRMRREILTAHFDDQGRVTYTAGA